MYVVPSFCVVSLDDKVRFDRVIRSNQIYNYRYFRHCWIIKYIGLKSIIFVINMDAASNI